MPTVLIRNTENHISVLHRSGLPTPTGYGVHVSLQETDQQVCHEGDVPRVQTLLGKHDTMACDRSCENVSGSLMSHICLF